MGLIESLGFALVIILFLIGSPLAVSFAVGSGVILLMGVGLPLQNFAQIFFSAIHSYPLLAMPFFILAGNLILKSGGMEPLRDFMKVSLGHLPGGMAVATIVFAAFLGSISGSAAACLAIIGTVLVPILVSAGYDRPFASGISVTAAELGLLIPPSLFFVLFGAFNQISIAELFMAGISPGLLSALFMAIIAVLISKKRKYKLVPKASWKERLIAFRKVIPVLLMPVIVLGGIYSGTFSPTQAASVSVVYAILMGTLIYRKMNWQAITEALVDSIKLSSMIYLLYIGGDLFGKGLSVVGLPQMIANAVAAMNMTPLVFLLVVELLLLVMGFFFSSIPMVMVVLPLFIPCVHQLGIDPVLYGCISVFCALIGEITPPVGPQLWIAAPICKEKMGNIAREAWPFLGAQVLALLLVTIFPDLALWPVYFMR